MDGTQEKPPEIDIDAEWEKACIAFANTTKGKQLKGRPLPTPEQISESIRNKAKSSKEPGKWNKLGKVLTSVGFALLDLGQVAGQIASMFFGPSQICMNAVSFFVDAAVRYKKVFDTLEELFEGVSKALDRFNIYRKNQSVLDYEMKVRANMILLQFTEICNLSYNVLIKHNKIGQFLKVTLFKSDEGVGDALNLLNKMTEDEAQMRSTLAYVSGKRTERNTEQSLELSKKTEKTTEQLLETSKETDAQLKRENQIKSLKDALGELDDSQNKQLRYCTTQALTDSGLWIADLEAYKQWSDLELETQQILLMLSGDEGCGKTFVASKVIELLKKRYSRRSDGRKAFVGYYYFGSIFDQSRTQKTDHSQASSKDVSRTLDTALRTLAMQIALEDEVYGKNLQNLLVDVGSLSSNIEELWNTLFVRSLSNNASYFLVLDDVHDLEKTETLSLLLKTIVEQSSANSQVRVLISGRTGLLGSASIDLGSSQATLDLASNNRDIIKYVESEVDKIPMLQGDSSAQVQALRQEIRDALGEINSFSQIKIYLDLVASKQRPDEIREVLGKSKNSSDMRNLIVVRLDEFNELPRADIQDLNQILEWIICSFATMTLENLKDILQVRRKKNSSLKPVRARIRDEFSGLFDLSGDDNSTSTKVTLRSETLIEHFQELTQKKKQESTLSDSKITEMEVKIVQRFLKNLCDEELYAKFAFEDFFEKKLAQSSKVFVDTDEMHARVALDCLKIALRENGEESRSSSVDFYARWFWVDHLIKLDISLVNQGLKLEIGKRLLPMLVDRDEIKKWLRPDVYAFYYICVEDYATTILRWIQESAVNRGCSAEHLEWIKKLSTPPNVAEEELWKPILKFQAEYWLCFENDEASTDVGYLECFRWIRAYLNRVETRRNTDKKPLAFDTYWTSSIEPEEVEAAANFAKEIVGVQSLPYHAQCRYANTLITYEFWEDTRDAYQVATNLKDDHWEASRGLAQAYQGLKEYENAINSMRPVVQKLEEKAIGDESVKGELRRSRLLLAEWNQSAEHYEEAREIYERLLEADPNDYETISDILTLLGTQGKRKELVAYLNTLKGQNDEETGRDRLSQLITVSAVEIEKHQSILYNVKQGGYIEEFQKAYREAIKHAEEKRSTEEKEKESWTGFTLVCLYFQAATSLHWHSESEEERIEAISLWEQSLNVDRFAASDENYSVFFGAQKQAATLLCLQYLAEARNHEPDSELVASNFAKIKALTPPEGGMQYINNPYLEPNEVELLTGYYHISRGDREQAMKALKPRVSIGVEMLSDHDPDNDWQGFWNLANAFSRFKDDVNALAALSLIAPTKNIPPPLDEINSQLTDQANSPSQAPKPQPTDTQPNGTSAASSNPEQPNGTSPATPAPETNGTATSAVGEKDTDPPIRPTLKRSSTSRLKRDPQGPLSFSCDGSCGTAWTYPSDMHPCRQCPDVQFCGSCLEKQRAGLLAKHICDKTHEFLDVPIWDFEAWRKIPKGSVKVGEKLVKVEEWLDGIREEWGIEKVGGDGEKKEDLEGEGKREGK